MMQNVSAVMSELNVN